MGLLQPELGLIFWTSLAFGVVLFLLCKFGFPVILRSIEERRNFIDSSIEAAHEAEERLERVTLDSAAIVEKAEAERQQILRSASEERDRIVGDARTKASEEAQRIVAEARAQANEEREQIIRDGRQQVVALAVTISERLLRGELQQKESQIVLADRLLDEINRGGQATSQNNEA